MNLADANSIYWKSKFIDGLPNLFAEKVRNHLREASGESISYHLHTYRSLADICIQKRLALCNDMKLKNKLKFQKITERKQLGKFCQQFAYDTPSKRQPEK